MVFPDEDCSETHLLQILEFITFTQHAIHICMYVLTHHRLSTALIDASQRKNGPDVSIIVDHMMMFCSGSKTRDLVADGVAVYVDVTPSYMQHYKYFVFDDRVAFHGSMNFSYHAIVSGGILAIHEDPRMIQPLAHHFASVKDSTIYRLVGFSELQHTKPCADCEHHARVTGSAAARRPPKKKGKAPKKTKEELDEERRLQEEEEARLKAEEEKRLEEERKKRELEEAKRREEEAKNRLAELERLGTEYEATKLDIEGKVQRLAEILRAQKEAKDWEKYLACEPRPDAQVEGDMNSFLNSWSLEVSTDIAEVAAACESANEVIDDLVCVGANANATNDTPLSDQCAMFVDKIQYLIHDKIEFASRHILQYADEYTDSQSRSEVKMASASNWLKLGLWINLIAKGSRNKRIDFSELGVSVDLPKAVIVQSLALRVAHLPYDPLSTKNSQNIDFALGGIFSLELLAIPPPPKRARGWMMREVADQNEPLKRLHYPLEGMVVSAALPVKVSLVLPGDVIYASTPRVGWWDSQGETWEEDGISEVVFHPETNVITFSTMKLTHLAVLQQRDLNHQKFYWHLTMSTKTHNKAHLRLKTEHYDAIHFEITDAGCRLVAPQLTQLHKLHREWFPPGELLTKLTASGIGLCPALDDDLRFGFTPKQKELEDRVIDEVVSVVSAYEVSIGNLSLESTSGGIKWLSAMENPRQVVFAVKEIDWPYVNSSSQRETAMNGDEDDNNMEFRQPQHPTSAAFVNVLTEVDDEVSGGGVKFRIDRSEDPYETHVHLKKVLEAISSPDAKDRMENSNVLFEFMLKKLLSLLRLFSYSKPLCTVASGLANGGHLATEEELLSSEVVAAAAEGLGLEDGAVAALPSDSSGAEQSSSVATKGGNEDPAAEPPVGELSI